jgi:hypothetical protein
MPIGESQIVGIVGPQGEPGPAGPIGTGNVGTALLDFGLTGKTETSVSVAAPSILSTSIVLVSLVAKDSADHSADEHLVEEIEVMPGAVTAGVGFTIVGRTGNFPLRGAWNVNWYWS